MRNKSYQFRCPSCRHPASKIISTYQLTDSRTIRRRRCMECDHRWYTSQEPESLIRPDDVSWGRPAGQPCFVIVDAAERAA